MTTTQIKKFKNAWANAVNSNNAKTQYLPCNEWMKKDPQSNPRISDITKYQNATITKHRWRYECISTGTSKKPGWIKGEHFLLYNILLNKPIDTGFIDRTNINKKNGFLTNHGIYKAYSNLYKHHIAAHHLIRNSNIPKFLAFRKYNTIEKLKKIKNPNCGIIHLIKFLEPLNDTINVSTIYHLNIPKIQPKYK
jgi:hypothetical protein